MIKTITLVLFLTSSFLSSAIASDYAELELKDGYDISNAAKVLSRAPVVSIGNCLTKTVEVNIQVILNEGFRYILDFGNTSEELFLPEDSDMISYFSMTVTRYNIPLNRNINRTRGYRNFVLESVECRFDPSKSYFIKF